MKRFFVLIALFICGIKCSFALKPDTAYKHLPSDFGIAYSEHQITTIDGLLINTWTLEPESVDSTTKTIIIAGADAGNMSANIIHAAYLTNHGFRVITFDYRGFGKSDKFKIDTSRFYYPEYEFDLQAVANYAYKRYEQRINILAISFGSVVSLNVLANDSLLFDKIVFDGLVSNPKDLIDRIEKAKHKKITEYPFDDVIFHLDKHESLIFAGSEDPFTTLEDAVTFHEQNPNSMIIVHSGGHLESLVKLEIRYFEYIKTFLNN